MLMDNPAADHGSFRQSLVFSIGFAVSRSRDLLRRLLKEHAPDDARQELAARRSASPAVRLRVDEDGQALRKRPPRTWHRTPGE